MKRVLRLLIMVPGLLYLWALLPLSFRPEYTGSPFRKPDPTVTLAVTAGSARTTTLSNDQLASACDAPRLLRPIVRPAHQVVVRLTVNGKVVRESRVDCQRPGPIAKNRTG